MRKLWAQARKNEVEAGPEPTALSPDRLDETEALRATLARMRESADLIEADLSGLIGAATAASDEVREATVRARDAVAAIHDRSEALTHKAMSATENARQLAMATEEFAQSAEEIGGQVRRASEATDVAVASTAKASASVDGLRASMSEIDAVVTLIAKIAKQTNLLALNASIEAARAGEMGRGFAVVANEVKALSGETHKATEEIARRIAKLHADSEASIEAIGGIATSVEAFRPALASVSSAVEQQVATVRELARSAAESKAFVDDVARGAEEIDGEAANATAASQEADAACGRAQGAVGKLGSRFTVVLRQSDVGDRRRHDRWPVEIAATIVTAAGILPARTVDVSEGGMLLAVADPEAFQAGALFRAEVTGVGAVELRCVAVSSLGLHCEAVKMDGVARAALDALVAGQRRSEDARIARAQDAAARISRALEDAVQAGQVRLDALFATAYEPIAGSDPPQFTIPALPTLERILPDIQEPLLASDPAMVFCAAVDRNAYLPVHNKVYSQPQRPGETAWNTANCRNRRIFDDRAGLAAARNTRPFLVQAYARDMGGKTVMMKEVDAPIRVMNRHWGGFRTAYKM
jgi:methyl-accepting chemotaxis protein